MRVRDLISILGLSLLGGCTNPPAATPAAQIVPVAPDAPAKPEQPVAAPDPVAPISPIATKPTVVSDVAAVLARAQAWLGGAEKLHAIRDITLRGSLMIAGHPTEILIRGSSAGWIRFDMGANCDPAAQGVDSAGGWALDSKGAVKSVSNSEAGSMRFQLAHLLAWYVEPAYGFQPKLVGHTQFEGTECDRIRLLDNGHGGFVDQCIGTDGAMLALCTRDHEYESWTRFSDWREVSGCRFPFLEEDESAHPVSTRWTTIQLNRDLDETAFQRPSAISVWRPVLETDITLPIDLFEGRYVYVSGEVAGWPADIFVDSGCSSSVLERSFARTLGITSKGELEGHGVSGPVSVSPARNVSVKLGSFELPTLDAGVIDLSGLEQFSNRKFRFILGMELFRALPVTIDYPGRSLTLHDPKRFEPPVGSIAVPVQLDENRGVITLAGRLFDLEPARFLLDTGSGNTLDFYSKYVSDHQLSQRFTRYADCPIIGIGATSSGRQAILGEFEMAEHVFHDLPISMSLGTRDPGAHSTMAGAVGAGLLARFIVTFDLPHGRVLFQPGDALDAPFDRDRLGIRVRMRDGSVVAEFVIAGSPAAKAGLVAGDEIVKLDGESLAADLLFTRLREVRIEAAGTTVRLTLKSGKEVVVDLADYY
jgi:hypothetical protein